MDRAALRLKPAAAILRRLRSLGNPESAKILQGFFKTGPGEYGEGDVFLGLRVPETRRLAKEFRDAAGLADIKELLQSELHEARLFALMLLVEQFQRGDEPKRREIYDLYLASTNRINNWDLVDVSAAPIVGGWLFARSRAPLHRLAKSKSLWERRISVIATLHFIRQGDFADTLKICELLLDDEQDLMHKACGWMLRETGKRDVKTLERFLDRHAAAMPRTMLRYAIERFPEPRRQHYLRTRRS
jgi:3-methyladenine DNA glycosylase AlkD